MHSATSPSAIRSRPASPASAPARFPTRLSAPASPTDSPGCRRSDPAHSLPRSDRQAGLKPISQPQVTDIQLDDGQPLHFKAVFEILPDFSIDGYQDVTSQSRRPHSPMPNSMPNCLASSILAPLWSRSSKIVLSPTATAPRSTSAAKFKGEGRSSREAAAAAYQGRWTSWSKSAARTPCLPSTKRCVDRSRPGAQV